MKKGTKKRLSVGIKDDWEGDRDNERYKKG